MNILDVMTKKDLMKPPEIRTDRNYGGYNLTAYFIKMHGRAMGGFAKPMIFDRNRVEAYLDDLFGQAERIRAEQAERDGQIKRSVDDAIARVRSLTAVKTTGPGQMLGRGGRVRTRDAKAGAVAW